MLLVHIGADGRCNCTCACQCPLRKTGSQARCTEHELLRAGIHVLRERSDLGVITITISWLDRPSSPK